MDKEYSKFLVYFCGGIGEYNVFAQTKLCRICGKLNPSEMRLLVLKAYSLDTSFIGLIKFNPKRRNGFTFISKFGAKYSRLIDQPLEKVKFIEHEKQKSDFFRTLKMFYCEFASLFF